MAPGRISKRGMRTEIYEVPREDALRMVMGAYTNFGCPAPHQKRFSWNDSRDKGFLQPKLACRGTTAVVKFRDQFEGLQEADPCTSGGLASQATCQNLHNVPNVRLQ